MLYRLENSECVLGEKDRKQKQEREESAGRETSTGVKSLGAERHHRSLAIVPLSTIGHLKRLWLVWAGQRRVRSEQRECRRGRAELLSADACSRGGAQLAPRIFFICRNLHDRACCQHALEGAGRPVQPAHSFVTATHGLIAEKRSL